MYEIKSDILKQKFIVFSKTVLKYFDVEIKLFSYNKTILIKGGTRDHSGGGGGGAI